MARLKARSMNNYLLVVMINSFISGSSLQNQDIKGKYAGLAKRINPSLYYIHSVALDIEKLPLYPGRFYDLPV